MFDLEHNLDNDVQLSGLFIAKVISNKDPKAMERVAVRVIGVHDMENDTPSNSIWAHHIRPDKTETSVLPTPDDKDYVYVMFMNNDPNSCFWLGWVNYISSEGLI
jgi:hypothetical protein